MADKKVLSYRRRHIRFLVICGLALSVVIAVTRSMKVPSTRSSLNNWEQWLMLHAETPLLMSSHVAQIIALLPEDHFETLREKLTKHDVALYKVSVKVRALSIPKLVPPHDTFTTNELHMLKQTETASSVLARVLESLPAEAKDLLLREWHFPLKSMRKNQQHLLAALFSGEAFLPSTSRASQSGPSHLHSFGVMEEWGQLQSVQVYVVFWPQLLAISKKGRFIPPERDLALPKAWKDLFQLREYRVENPEEAERCQESIGQIIGNPSTGNHGPSSHQTTPPVLLPSDLNLAKLYVGLALRRIRSMTLPKIEVKVERPLVSLQDLVRDINRNGAIKLRAHRGKAGENILITPGKYSVSDLVAGVCVAMGLVPEQQGRTVFLSTSPEELTPEEGKWMSHEELKWRAETWKANMGWLYPSPDTLSRVNPSFPAQVYFDGMSKTLKELTAVQNDFVRKQFPKSDIRFLLTENDTILVMPGMLIAYQGLAETLPVKVYVRSEVHLK